MSHALYRLGCFAARRPWRVIATWLLLAVVVIGTSAGFGRKLEDSFSAPGLDSSTALDLLTAARSDAAGPTAQVVVAPKDGTTFFDSPTAVAALTRIQGAVRALPNVLGTSDPAAAVAAGRDEATASGSVSPDGRVALIRVQYRLIEELSVADLDNLKQFAVEARRDSALQVELNGDLFFSFEEPGMNVGELVGLIVAVVILLVAFGSVLAMGLPIGLALFGLALGISSMSLITYLIEIPSWAPQMASMVGLGVGIDYALILVTRHREFLAQGQPLTAERIDTLIAFLSTLTDRRYESIEPGFASFLEGNGHSLAGRFDRFLEICGALVTQTGSARPRMRLCTPPPMAT